MISSLLLKAAAIRTSGPNWQGGPAKSAVLDLFLVSDGFGRSGHQVPIGRPSLVLYWAIAPRICSHDILSAGSLACHVSSFFIMLSCLNLKCTLHRDPKQRVQGLKFRF